MNKFKIVGPVDPNSDDFLYWSVKANAWVIYKLATAFNKDILRHTLPIGAVGILEYSKNKSTLFHSFERWGGYGGGVLKKVVDN